MDNGLIHIMLVCMWVSMTLYSCILVNGLENWK